MVHAACVHWLIVVFSSESGHGWSGGGIHCHCRLLYPQLVEATVWHVLNPHGLMAQPYHIPWHSMSGAGTSETAVAVLVMLGNGACPMVPL